MGTVGRWWDAMGTWDTGGMPWGRGTLVLCMMGRHGDVGHLFCIS